MQALTYDIGLTNRSRYAEVLGKQDEVQGTSASPMVLSGLPETMQRREWFQVPCTIGISSAADVGCRRACRKAYQRFLLRVSVRVCEAAF